MATYDELLKRAKRGGYEITEDLKRDLRLLAGVSDEEIEYERRRAIIKRLAKDFQVPVAAMEVRIGETKL